MKVNNLLLPHPVLGRKDDVSGTFALAGEGFSIEQDDKNTKLEVEFILENKTLEYLILKREAKFNIEVECPATFYRKSFPFSKNRCEINIDKNDLRGKVTVSFFITSEVKKPGYKIDEANPDYEGAIFDINEGDVLGYAGTDFFDAEILWEDLRRIFNIIQIKKTNELEEGPAVFSLTDDIIYIYLSKNDYSSYISYKDKYDSFTDIYHSSIVLSALTHGLMEMKSERKDEYVRYKWYRALDSRIINDSEIKSMWEESGNIPRIAQLMLGNPFKRMFSSIEQIAIKQEED